MTGVQTCALPILYENLEGFGEELAGDGKAIQSYAKRTGKGKDRRSERDANLGVKKYTENRNGEKMIKMTSWFGYKLHLIVDVKYELPVAYKITQASNSEKTADLLDLPGDRRKKR